MWDTSLSGQGAGTAAGRAGGQRHSQEGRLTGAGGPGVGDEEMPVPTPSMSDAPWTSQKGVAWTRGRGSWNAGQPGMRTGKESSGRI